MNKIKIKKLNVSFERMMDLTNKPVSLIKAPKGKTITVHKIDEKGIHYSIEEIKNANIHRG